MKKEPTIKRCFNIPIRLLDKLQKYANRDTNGDKTAKIRQLLEEMK